MKKVTVRSFVLSHAQLTLAYIMVRRFEIQNSSVNDVHNLLTAKIQAALIRSRQQSWPAIHLNEIECRMMRNCNTDYCVALAARPVDGDHWKSIHTIRTYKVANQLQILFSTRSSPLL